MAMYDRGVSIPQAASIWGCSVKVLRRMIREHGIARTQIGHPLTVELPQGMSITLNGLSHGSSTR